MEYHAAGLESAPPQFNHGVCLPFCSLVYVSHFTFTFHFHFSLKFSLFTFTFHWLNEKLSSTTWYGLSLPTLGYICQAFHFHFLLPILVVQSKKTLRVGPLVSLGAESLLSILILLFQLKGCWNHKGDIGHAFEVLQAHEDLWRGSWVFLYVLHAGTKSLFHTVFCCHNINVTCRDNPNSRLTT